MEILKVFKVDHLHKDFSKCLINSERQKKKALLGDAMILLHFRKLFLESYPTESIGFISEMTKIFIENKSMKLFLLSLAPEEFQLYQMSDHSVGTVFEALLSDSSDPTFALNIYFEFITEELNPETLVRTVTQNTSGCAATVIESQDFMKNIEKAILQYKPKPKFHPSITRSQTLSLANYLYDNSDVETLPHKPDSVIQISWRSRNKHTYNEEFYSCCGANCSKLAIAYRENCLRNTWKNRNYVHTGYLTIDYSSRMGGGYGPTGGSYDHLPRCKSATWTCCGRDSLTEGCTALFKSDIGIDDLTVDQLDSEKVLKKRKAWVVDPVYFAI
mmetsp:Transcript_19612/g.21298  ORF Transcript_19612/g.21298 Transcript_19612/m.21298 type:complete len:330 (-) Transcript_19612:13-1002(-)